MKAQNTTLNRPQISTEWKRGVATGLEGLCEIIEVLAEEKRKQRNRFPVLAFDGFPGVDWAFMPKIRERLKERSIPVETVDGCLLYKKQDLIWEVVRSFITSDPFFGKIFKGELEDFLDFDKVRKTKEKFFQLKKKRKKLVICFGHGTTNRFLRRLYDNIFYFDLTREKFLKRVQKLSFIPSGAALRRGAADVGLSIQDFKLSQYIYYPVFDKYRRKMLKCMDFYAVSCGNDYCGKEELEIIPKNIFDGILSNLAKYPIRLKPLYIQSPWGGQWIKKMRKLPKDFINCAWGFEAVTPDMSVLISIGQKTLEIPFITFLSKERKQLMGTKASKKFGWFFPIRIHYDDSYDGGNMAIQVHPNGSYVKKHFNESVGQHEAYYIVKTKLGSKVYLGLKENISLKDLFEAAKRAKYEKKPLDYENYVNSIPSAPGDLFLIPAGTIHALGKDQVCLEIGTSYGYTFHVYDYLRPNLKGNLREIHLDHSLGALKDYRRTNWVRNNLKQPPKILRSFESGTEYLLGWLRGVPFEVHRIEFTRKAEDDTSGRFHILTLIKGKDIEIRSVEDPSKSKKIHFSETVIVPAAFGRYGIVGDGQCVILKVLLRE